MKDTGQIPPRGRPDSKEEQAANMAQAIKRMFEEMNTPAYRERNMVLALDRRQRFLAHLEAGFTEQQALELVK